MSKDTPRCTPPNTLRLEKKHRDEVYDDEGDWLEEVDFERACERCKEMHPSVHIRANGESICDKCSDADTHPTKD